MKLSKKLSKGAAIGAFGLIAAIAISPSFAGHNKGSKGGNNVRVIQGVAVTGDNNLFQQPIWNLGETLGTGFFNWVFVHDPYGNVPMLMTEDMPGDSVLAGGLDPVAQFLGLAPASVDPSMLNQPLHQTPVTTANNGAGIGTGNRAQVPNILEYPGGAAVTRAASNRPVTIDSWFKAKGRVKVKCKPNGTSVVTFKMSNLIENGVYTLWSIYLNDADGDGQDDGVAPYPLGGVPNVVVPTGDRGKAEISRKLSYCPFDEEKLLFFDVAWHSDGNVYGGVPDLPFDPVLGQPMGIVTHTHLQFPFNVTPIN